MYKRLLCTNNKETSKPCWSARCDGAVLKSAVSLCKELTAQEFTKRPLGTDRDMDTCEQKCLIQPQIKILIKTVSCLLIGMLKDIIGQATHAFKRFPINAKMKTKKM